MNAVFVEEGHGTVEIIIVKKKLSDETVRPGVNLFLQMADVLRQRRCLRMLLR